MITAEHLKKLCLVSCDCTYGLIANDITCDSRHVRPGNIFVSMPSVNMSQQLRHIQEAIDKGARFILQNKSFQHVNSHSNSSQLTFINVINIRRAYGQLAANLYPRSPTMIVGITGTSGKTSTASFLRQIWTCNGFKAATIGTLGLECDIPDIDFIPSSLTSPDAMTLHRNLTKLADHGITHLAMEASSHGLDQHRLDFVRFKGAAFTNLSHDHLDYHANMHDYFAAKCKLFTHVLPPGGFAALNQDDYHYRALSRLCYQHKHRVLSFGKNGHDIRLVDSLINSNAQDVIFESNESIYRSQLPFPKGFQNHNVVAAISLALGSGLSPQQIMNALPSLKNVPGRFEHVANIFNGHIYVDYAHKPDALENVLKSFENDQTYQIITVFGCGGNRDTLKRSVMGMIAAQYSDIVIVTDDNPRFEDAATIRQQIRQGCPDAIEIADRKEAIQFAVEKMQNHPSIVIVAGKGHESGQIVGDQVLPFDDRQTIKNICCALIEKEV